MIFGSASLILLRAIAVSYTHLDVYKRQRFYELMAGQTKPLFVPLEGRDGLRERFGLQGKYERVSDLKRYVLDVAKAELDEYSPYSFVAKEEKDGRKVIGWTPVSYTHLDVYKRQVGLCFLFSLKTEKTLHYRNRRAWLKLRHGSSWRTTYMTCLLYTSRCV